MEEGEKEGKKGRESKGKAEGRNRRRRERKVNSRGKRRKREEGSEREENKKGKGIASTWRPWSTACPGGWRTSSRGMGTKEKNNRSKNIKI